MTTTRTWPDWLSDDSPVDFAVAELARELYRELMRVQKVESDAAIRLEKTLIRYEGAVSECEREGDDSNEAVAELTAARSALLAVLIQAKLNL